MSPLPLKVQLGIRDHWSKEDGPLQKVLKELNELLGQTVLIQPEWPMLLAELENFYADKGNFVIVVAGCVETWIKSLLELLGDPVHEDWVDDLLGRTRAAGGRMNIFLEVASDEKTSTTWSDRRQGFVIWLPRVQVYQPAELFPVICGELLTSFEPAEEHPFPDRTAGAAAADDWANIEMDTSTGKVDVVGKPKAATAAPLPPSQRVEFLPSAASLPRPDELLLKPPYHLVVYISGTSIEIQGSHSPSLQLLADYLRRWCRINHNDSRSPPAVDVKLQQSSFGLGEMFDRLDLTARGHFHITAPMVLSLVEGVLGYQCVSAQPGTWSFRRDAAFKKL